MITPPSSPIVTIKENNYPPPAPSKKKRKKKKTRCYQCNIKLTLIEKQLLCKCKRHFCMKHRLAVEVFKDNGHICTFNYKEEGLNRLNKAIGECKIINKQMDKL
jgi:hypothetical protein